MASGSVIPCGALSSSELPQITKQAFEARHVSVVYGLVPFDGGVAPALAYVMGLLVDGADVGEGHEDFPDLLRDVRQRVGEPYLVGPHDRQARKLLQRDVGNEECHLF